MAKKMFGARIEEILVEEFHRRAESEGMRLETALDHALRSWLRQPVKRDRLKTPER